MKLCELLDELADFNPEAEVAVVVYNTQERFTQ